MLAAIPFPDIAPEIFSVTLFGTTFALRWYALAYMVGIVIGWRLILVSIRGEALWRDGTAPLDAEQVDALLTWVVVGIIAGGRLGYVLFYSQGAFWSDPMAILRVWEGGMSFHGGFAGVVLAVWLFCRKNKCTLSGVSDLLALSVPMGLLLGRLANFINAELWGRPTDAPWGVIFPGAAAQDCGANVLTLCARHPSQLYEALLEGLLLGALLLWVAWRRGGLRKPWLVTGLFFAGYGLSRFIVEFVRQPDQQFVTADNPLGLAFHSGGFGLTMGQTLSLPMIAVGLALVIVARRA